MVQAKPCGVLLTKPVTPSIGPAQVDDSLLKWTGSEEYQRYLRGSATLRLLVESDSAHSFLPLTVTLLSKSLDAANWRLPFQPQCTSVLTNNTEIVGRDEQDGSAPLLWMIRISATPLGTGFKTLRIRAWEDDASSESPQLGVNGMLGIVPELVCQKKSLTRYQVGSQGQSVFATQAMLSVALDDQEASLDSSVMRKLGLYVTESLATWNAACFNCATNNLLLVKVGHDLYLNSILASAYRQAAHAGLSPAFMADLDMIIALMRRNASASGVQYEFIEKDDPAINAICSSYEGWRDPRMMVVRNGLGCPAPGDHVQAKDISQVTVKLRGGLTSCLNNGKRDPNIIACEKSDQVELDTGDFAFVSHESEDILFGKGNRQVDLLRVVAHELGHWIGLSHLQPGIMAADFPEADCINDAVVDRLLGAVNNKQSAQQSTLIYRVK